MGSGTRRLQFKCLRMCVLNHDIGHSSSICQLVEDVPLVSSLVEGRENGENSKICTTSTGVNDMKKLEEPPSHTQQKEDLSIVTVHAISDLKKCNQSCCRKGNSMKVILDLAIQGVSFPSDSQAISFYKLPEGGFSISLNKAFQ